MSLKATRIIGKSRILIALFIFLAATGLLSIRSHLLYQYVLLTQHQCKQIMIYFSNFASSAKFQTISIIDRSFTLDFPLSYDSTSNKACSLKLQSESQCRRNLCVVMEILEMSSIVENVWRPFLHGNSDFRECILNSSITVMPYLFSQPRI